MGRNSFPFIGLGKAPIDHLVDSMKVGCSLGTRVRRPISCGYGTINTPRYRRAHASSQRATILPTFDRGNGAQFRGAFRLLSMVALAIKPSDAGNRLPPVPNPERVAMLFSNE